MPRKSASDLAASFAAKAEAYRIKALIAESAILENAIKLRDMIGTPTESDSARLLEALTAFVDGRLAK